MRQLTDRLGIRYPIIQAPMAGVSMPKLAAVVSEAGAIRALRELTTKPFNVNLFTHRPARAEPEREARWLEHLRPHFTALGAPLPAALPELFTSFLADPAMLDVTGE
nr:nitronate monooxygenase [Duganella lactea]